MDAFTLQITLVLLARVTLGLIFLRSAWAKCADLRGFQRGVVDYHLLPAWAVAPLAWALPLVEFALALALLVGVALPFAAAGAACLLLAFSVAIVINLRRGRAIACNCHGSAQQTPISWGLVARNALLLALGLVLMAAVPFNASFAALAATWRAELAVVLSWDALPLALVLGCAGACSLLLATVIDVRHAVRQVAETGRSN